MSRCVEKIVHKACGKNGLQVFQKEGGGYDGWCFICNKYEANPYEDQPPDYKPAFQQKSPEEIQNELDEVDEFQTHAITSRKLKKEYLQYFGIKTAVSQEDGETPTATYFPYGDEKGKLIGYKVRLLSEKRMWAVGTTRGAAMFGWELAKNADGPRLYITEGEYDAVALFQVLKDKNKDKPQFAAMNPPVVSLPAGSGSVVKTLVKYLPDIRKRFKEVVLVFDNDDAGKKAVEEALKIIPDALVAELPAKDANDCILEGKSNALFAAVRFNSSTPKNTRIINGRNLHEKAKKPAEWGIPWPWKGINEKTRGIRTGETIYLGAGQKQGKSEVVNQLAAYLIEVIGWKVFLVKPEEANEKTYKLVCGKVAKKRFTDPKVPFDEDAFDKAGEVIGDSLMMLDLYQHVGWQTLQVDIRHAAANGCKAVFIDPITNLTNGMSAANANEALQGIAQELSALAKDLDIVVFIFCHLRNPDGGPSHERGGEVLSSQFAGSRAMARSCNLMLGLEGNRDPSLPSEQQNIRQFVILENRETGEVGRFPFYWDSNTTIFTEM